jgi:hypothetical protein
MHIAFAIVAAVVLMFFAVGFFLQAAVQAWDRLCWIHADHVARNVGNSIAQESYWFSESPEAVEALKAIGKALSRNGQYRISEARDEWRREMEKEKIRAAKVAS